MYTYNIYFFKICNIIKGRQHFDLMETLPWNKSGRLLIVTSVGVIEDGEHWIKTWCETFARYNTYLWGISLIHSSGFKNPGFFVLPNVTLDVNMHCFY